MLERFVACHPTRIKISNEQDIICQNFEEDVSFD
jgi:hypothetical protein